MEKSPVSKARRIKPGATPSGSIGIKAAGALDRFKRASPSPAAEAANPRSLLPEPLQQVERTFVLRRGRKLSYFGGCDYFRLSSHPAVLGAWRDGLGRYGLNVAASRATTGNHWLYETLEKRLAQFFGVESVLLVSCGYLANLAVAQTLAGGYSQVLIDERSHASLLDAAQLFGCPIITFRHLIAEAFAAAVQRCGPAARPILLTDGLFSHDGEVAPLDRYLEVLPSAGSVLVDDAHGAGVLGRSGRGTAEYLRVPDERLIQTITLSKAFGGFGGAILGTRALRARMIARSRSFSGSTPMPLPLVCAALAAVKLLQTDRGLRRRLAGKTDHVKRALRKVGLPGAPVPSPIIPFIPRHADQAAMLKRRLLGAGIHPPFIHYPGGPASGFFRFSLSSEHTQPQLDGLIRVLGPIAQAEWAGGAGAAGSRRGNK